MQSRPKRKSSLEALEKMCSPNVWSPQKGVQRNPTGYNAHNKTKRQPSKRKIIFSPAQKVRCSKRRGVSKKMKWRRGKGSSNVSRYKHRKQESMELQLQEKNRRIADYRENMKEIESLHRRRNNNFLWQATVVFTLFATLLAWTESGETFRLGEIAAFVGSIVLSRPNCRVVTNLYNSWRLTRSFKPLYRGRAYHNILDDCPMVKRKIIKWARRRIIKRKKDEEVITSLQFMGKINELFRQYNVLNTSGQQLKWSQSTACRYMHRLQLEYGGYTQNYCDGHEREDVLADRDTYIQAWYQLEPRMHLWIEQVDVETSASSWRHVDEFKLKGPKALDRGNLGEFGGKCKVGIEYDPLPANRPLLVFANDECIFRTKRSNPKGWKLRTQNKLRPKDALGTGRMLSGFAHEFAGFFELTDEELVKCNEARAERGDPPIKHKMFTLKKFDYGKNREVYMYA